MAARYDNLGLLADGGMAEICLGRDIASGERVAIKRIKRDCQRDPEFLAMFTDEGRLWERLRHPNIVLLRGVGQDDEGPFICMELVEGLDLAEILTRHAGPLPLAFTLSVAADLCDALAYIHDFEDPPGTPLGLVHRDVSPGNLLCGCDGCVKLTDFGVAQAAVKTHQTRAGDLKGKIAYMSPEQTRGETLRAASDLFSTGVVLWEMLAGTALFDRPTDLDTAQAIRDAVVPRLASYRSDVDLALEELVAELLRPEPSARPSSAGQVALRLRRVARERGLALGPTAVRAVVEPLARAAGALEDRVCQPTRRRTSLAPGPEAGVRAARRPLMLFSAASIGALLLAAGAWWWLGDVTSAEDLPRPQPPAAQPALAPLPDPTAVGALAEPAPSPAPKAEAEPAPPAPAAPAPHAAPARRTPSAAGRASAPGPAAKDPAAPPTAGVSAEGFGTLDLNAEPWAKIAIDGVPLGRNTPLRGFSLAAGVHKVTLHNPVFGITKTLVIEVKPGQRVRQVVNLMAETPPASDAPRAR